MIFLSTDRDKIIQLEQEVKMLKAEIDKIKRRYVEPRFVGDERPVTVDDLKV